MRCAGAKDSDILVVLEPCNISIQEYLNGEAGRLLIAALKNSGVHLSKVAYIIPAPELPRHVKEVEKSAKEFVLSFRDKFVPFFNTFRPKLLIYIGKYACLQAFNKIHKATEFEGVVKKLPEHSFSILGVGSLNNAVLYRDSIDLVTAQLNMVQKLAANDYVFTDELYQAKDVNYEWRVDISDVLANKPKAIAFDTETTGLDWKIHKPIVYQMTFKEGHSILSPISEDYFPEYFKEKFGEVDYDKLRDQWKEIIEDQNIKKIGHNIKFDMHMAMNLGHRLNGLFCDTLQMLWSIDENLPSKGLDNAVKIYVPEMRGYADTFNAEQDKSNMVSVHPDKMLFYAGGDTDATYRLAKKLYPLAKKDPENLRVFTKVKMPAIDTFFDMERNGIRVDTDYFETIGNEYAKEVRLLEKRILMLVPPKVRRKYMFGKSGMKEDPIRIGNKDLIRDAFFSPDGFGIEPFDFDESTKNTDNPKPSLSTSKHLKFFSGQGFEAIEMYLEHAKLSKMSETYTGNREEGTGLWQHITFNQENKEYRIHPTFNIHTDTGRCLTGDTIVKLQRGTKRLDEIKVGDKVITHTGKVRPVTKLFKFDKKEVFGVILEDNTRILGTLDHRLMLDDGSWVKIKNLKLGQKLKCFESGTFTDKKIKGIVERFWVKEGKKTIKEFTVYDIEVEEDHSYIANGIVSHNSNCRNPNMQNPPSKGELAKQFKKSIIVPQDYVLLALDYSQMELRCIAWAAAEKAMQEIYAQGLDIHAKTAAEVLMRITLEEFRKVDKTLRKELRSKAKAIIFGFMYGLLAKGFVTYAKLLYGFDFSQEEAEIIRDTVLNKTYPRLGKWHEEVKAFANKHGYVRSLHGSVRHLPALKSADKWVRLAAERQAINSTIQEFGSDMGLMALHYIRRDFDRKEIRPINFIHDALYFEVRESLALEYATYVKYYMENVPIEKEFGIKSPVPFIAEPDIGRNWADVYALAELIDTTENIKDKNTWGNFSKEFNLDDSHKRYFNEKDGILNMKAVKPEWCKL